MRIIVIFLIAVLQTKLRHAIVTVITFSLVFSFQSLNASPSPQNSQSAGIGFTENKSQVRDQNYQPRPDILYGVAVGNMAVHIKKNGVSYQLFRVEKSKSKEGAAESVWRQSTKQAHQEADKQTVYRIDLTWLNHNSSFSVTHDEVLPGYDNYYLEYCPEGVLNVKSYKGVTLHNLYKGIDLHYYGKKGELKHDYIVAPYTDYKQIQLQVNGAEINIGHDGSLLLTTPLGQVQEGAPIVYQNGKQLNAKWRVAAAGDSNVLSFEIESYNPEFELIIDPLTRLWGTYYGVGSEDEGTACTTDAHQNVYMTGRTIANTSTLLATVGSHQSMLGGFFDAFLVKFDANGVRQWGTYYGGMGDDQGWSCATDANGNVYMTGKTSLTTGSIISTGGSHQAVFGGGSVDAFLVKFNASGVRQWATFYGGPGNDIGSSCATDVAGDIYLTGFSNSNIGIATAGSHQLAYGGGSFHGDAYLVKFNTNGVRQWGTYYGGTDDEYGVYCTTDVNGNVYLAGCTKSGTGIATVGSHQSVHGGGNNNDGFLVKFNLAGVRQWGTYYGGAAIDEAHTCAVDSSGNVYLAGGTQSSIGIVMASVGSHQPVYSGSGGDAYLVKFNASGGRLWGTYYGGSGFEAGNSCAAYGGDVYLVGTSSTNTGTDIATVGSYQAACGGYNDAYIVKFDGTGVRQWGTYYGGSGYEDDNSCFITPSGNFYLAGYTGSSTGTVIATSGSHQNVYGGGVVDAYLVKFDLCELAPATPLSINGTTTLCSGATTAYTTPLVLGTNSYTLLLPGGGSLTSITNTLVVTPFSSGVFTLIAGNACGVSPHQTLSVTVNPLPVVTVSTTNDILCIGESATLTASGASAYMIYPGDPGEIFSVSPTLTTTYTITGVDSNGCSNTAMITLNVDECIDIKERNASYTRIRLYPNPTAGIFNLELNAAGEVTIFNAGGQLVYDVTLRSGKHQMDLSYLTKGIYILRFGDEFNSRTLKLVKE